MKGIRATLKSALVASAMASAPAMANDTVVFSVNDVALTAPIPSGYCLPSGQDKEIADQTASLDPANVTHATLIRCERAGRKDGFGNDVLVVKTPVRALALTVSRAEFLRALSAQFGAADWKSGSQSAEILEKVGENLSAAAKVPVVLDGGIAPRGSDEDCIYLGGQLTVSVSGKSVTMAMGACGTSVGHKLVNISAYGDYQGPDSIIAMMRKARDFAMSITKLADTAP